MNKYLVLIYVPVIEKDFNVLIPINKKIGTVLKAIVDTIFELYEISNTNKESIKLYDKLTGKGYDENMLIIESDIKNGSKLILL